MASQSFIREGEQKVIELIEAVKYEATVAEDNFKVSAHNYATWFSLMENTELLLNELKKYVCCGRPK
jgi:hypothetical protein